MVGRSYRAPISIGATTVQVDIFELLAGSNTPLALTGFHLGQTSEVGDAQEEQLQLVLKYITGAPTSGSGGNAAVAVGRILPGDAATSATLETGNTTKLTGGTAVELARYAWNIRQDLPVTWIPEMWQVVAGGNRIVLELATTPADSIAAIVGSIEFMELV
jgi:hypothetical protein